MTEDRVRYLLKHRREILNNVVKSARCMMVAEEEQEIITALALAAVELKSDSVQTQSDPSDAAVKMIAAKNREMCDQQSTSSEIAWRAKSMLNEVEALDLAVMGLHATQQTVILNLYYEMMTVTECAVAMRYSYANVLRIKCKAIVDVAKTIKV